MQFKQSEFRRPTCRPPCHSHPHNPVLTTLNKLSPLTVGNGELAYTADVTGLQTFLEFYSRDGETNSTPPGPDGFETNPELEGSTPLVTQSQWGYHTFPNPQNFTMEDAMQTYDTNPDLHSTQEIDSDSQSVTWHRILDEDEYYVRFASDNTLNIASPEKHHYKISFSDLSGSLSFSIEFSDEQLSDDRPDPNQTNNAVTDHWENFWTSGGAIDLSEGTDTRAHELERRTVLSPPYFSDS